MVMPVDSPALGTNISSLDRGGQKGSEGVGRMTAQIELRHFPGSCC